jgi:hypothetical protein
MHAAADSGCNETAQLMCERSNHGLCRLQRKSWHCGHTRVMDVLAMERRTIQSGLSIGREESQGIVSGRSLTTVLLGSLDAHLRGLGVSRQVDRGRR